MHHNILDTIKQTLTLVSFCRKVGIDYDVYLFTDAYHKHTRSYHDVCKEDQIVGHIILDNFNMLNVLTSKSNNRQHDRQILNLFRIAYAISTNRSHVGVPYTLHMGGTPLNESLISMNEIIPAFKKRTGAQKVHVVCLTDGDGHPLRAAKRYVCKHTNEEEIFASHMGQGYFLRDRKTGKMYAFEGGYYYSQTNQFVHYLRDRFPECSIMNIRLLGSGEWHRFKIDCFGDDYTYKYNDDLFKKITTIPDAKSHGLIFNVDWSGSMHHQVLDTIKQTLTLVSFCRKVGIDYDVYLFTDAYEYHGSYHDVAKESLIDGKVILDNFNMINVLSSKTNKRVADRQQQNLFRLASSIVHYGGVCVPQKLRLGGTPLNESLIAMNDIIPEFKTRTGAQKVHVVCLTDGDGNPLRAGKKYVDREGTESLFASHMGAGYILRDRKTGRMYPFSGDYYSGQTRQFVSYLRDRFPECSFMNIRLLGSGEWHRFKIDCFGDDYTEENVARANAEWKKTKSFICASSYWTVQYWSSSISTQERC